MQRLWGSQLPSAPGLTFEQMLSNGKLKALVVMDDNPLMLAPDSARKRRSLESLEFLAVIDSLPTDTANLAHAVLAGVSPWAKEGTTTSADRRILRMHAAVEPQGEARQGWRILSELGTRLAERLNPGEIRINYQRPAEIMEEIAQVVPLYRDATYSDMDSGARPHINGLGPRAASRQAVPAVPLPVGSGGFTLLATRSLYMSYEAAAIHSPEADRLHREDSVKINPADAASLGLSEGDRVTLSAHGAQITVPLGITAAVQRRMLYLPLYFDAGAVTALFDSDAHVVQVELARA
jgi:predicted molibdopterin-dependent oxidoreductase YjgC